MCNRRLVRYLDSPTGQPTNFYFMRIAGEIVPRRNRPNRNRTQIECVRFLRRYRTQDTIYPEISYPENEILTQYFLLFCLGRKSGITSIGLDPSRCDCGMYGQYSLRKILQARCPRLVKFGPVR